ncbi:MAG: ATP-binding protein [Bacteroidales bacterium]|nr:ATP-binding protein [Bacteroidales bacterium]
MKRHREIRITSSLDELYRVEQFVEEISDEHMLYGSYFGNIMMAVSEAAQNAIIHGNKLDKTKYVRIGEALTREGLWIHVIDEGIGFNYKDYQFRDDAPGFGLDKTGLLLIQKLCDDVRFLNNGSSIEMLFRINGIDEQIFSRREAFMHDFFRVYQKLSI